MKRPVDDKYKIVTHMLNFQLNVYADVETLPFLLYCVRITTVDNRFVGINISYNTIDN